MGQKNSSYQKTCIICNTNFTNIIVRKIQSKRNSEMIECPVCKHIFDSNQEPSQSYNDNQKQCSIVEKYSVARQHLCLGENGEILNGRQYGEIFGNRIKFAQFYFDKLYNEASISNRSLRMLDIGCGASGSLKFFNDIGFEVFGIDTDKEALNFQQTICPQAHLKLGFFPEINFNKKMDIVLAFHVLEHIPNPSKFLQHIYDACAEPALLLFEVPYLINYRNTVETFTSWQLWGASGVHLHHYSTQSMAIALSLGGWSILEYRDFFNYKREVLTGAAFKHNIKMRSKIWTVAKNMELDMNYKNFIFNQERGFIFVYVPKAACTNWKSLLRYMEGYDDWLDNKLAHDKVKGGLRYLALETEDADLLNEPGIRKFTMVRDPYSRILSAYINKLEERLPLKAEAPNEDYFYEVLRDIDKFRQDSLDIKIYPEINFEVFLRWLRDSGSWYTKDEHWAPQVTLLRYPDIQYDIIGRFENLQMDAPKLLSAMNCDQKFPSQKDVNFPPMSAQTKIDKYYNANCFKLVNEIYAEDFQAFSYNHHTHDEVTEVNQNSKSFRSTSSTINNNASFDQNFRFSSDNCIGIRPQVVDTISPNDYMWKTKHNKASYLEEGWSAARTIFSACMIEELSPRTIVDFGCGHGRVLRWLNALFPNAHLIAVDRVADPVNFCAETFGATPFIANSSFDDLNICNENDLIWLGSVYTHLPMFLWIQLTESLLKVLTHRGLLSFSIAGPYVAKRFIDGQRNPHAEIAENEFDKFINDYINNGFAYANHKNITDRYWGRSVISHSRLFQFIHDLELEIVLYGERSYAKLQDVIVVRKRKM